MGRLVALAFLILPLLAPGSAAAQYRRGGEGFIHGPISLGPRVGRDF